jgi:hypothetical protein
MPGMGKILLKQRAPIFNIYNNPDVSPDENRFTEKKTLK